MLHVSIHHPDRVSVCEFKGADGQEAAIDFASGGHSLSVFLEPHRARALEAAFNGAAVVDLDDILTLRNFIRFHAARAGLGVFEREVME